MPSSVTVAHRIGPEWIVQGEAREGRNPARPDEVVAVTHVGGPEQAAAAVAAARGALSEWARMPAPARGDILFRAAGLVSERAEAIGTELTREEGKTLAEGIGETRRAAAILRYFAGRTTEPVGEIYASATPGTRLHTLRQPVGVVGVLTPWNFPIAIPAWKVAPALAFGNAVVLKAASATPLTAFRLVEALVDAGLPPGVLNLVHAPGAAVEAAWLREEGVDALSFTGSAAVGRRLQAKAVAHHVKVQVEMGGKNAVVVAPDADLPRAAEMIARGAFMSAGQKCTATSRVIVIGEAAGPLREALAERVRRQVVGDPLDPATTVGPVIDADAVARIEGMVSEAAEAGARTVARADVPGSGWYSPPTLLDGVSPEAPIAREEVFGPVVALLEAPDLDAALRLHDAVRYGLSASIFTRDLATADAFVHRARAGIVHVNGETAGAEPHVAFGGMKGSSSWSREQGRAAEEFYTQTKTVYWDGMAEAGLFDAVAEPEGPSPEGPEPA
jgi:alpha-ketoglutaric semialdehyde dehydrogenase